MENKRRAFTLLFLFVFMDVLGFGLILPLLPYYAEAFGATAEVVGLLLGANALTQLAAQPSWAASPTATGVGPCC